MRPKYTLLSSLFFSAIALSLPLLAACTSAQSTRVPASVEHLPTRPRLLARVDRLVLRGYEDHLTDGTTLLRNAFELSVIRPPELAGLKMSAHCDCLPKVNNEQLAEGQCLSFLPPSSMHAATDLDLLNTQDLRIVACDESPSELQH
jgi:hypothetical protein